MSNISKAEKNLKRKLSLDDYRPTDDQQAPVGQTYITDSAVSEQTAPEVPTVPEKISVAKIKATYYLSEEDHSALTGLYIKRLQNKQKTDRSALVSEAIRLLYKEEMK